MGRLDADEFESFVVVACGEFTTAGETGGGSAEGTDAFEYGGAFWALVGVLALQGAPGEREVVAAGLVLKTEIGTSLLPFGPVRGDFTATDPVLSEKVCEFVKKGAMDLVLSEALEFGVENDVGDAWVSETRGAAHSGVPEDPEFVVKVGEAEAAELFADEFCELRRRMAVR